MVGIRKTFNSGSFASNDPKSRETVISYMQRQGFQFFENPDRYGVDLVCSGSVALEIERRVIWDDVQFPYDEINIPARKQRVLGNDNTHYIIVNKAFNRIGICLGKVLKKYLTRVFENPNQSVTSGEYFFKVPADEFRWVQV